MRAITHFGVAVFVFIALIAILFLVDASYAQAAETIRASLLEAQGKISLLEKNTAALTDKVKELEREKLRNAKLEQELQAANAKIVSLSERMARYEGENVSMQAFISKLKIVSVEQADPTTEEVA